jgi:hypothetical protein
LPASDTKEGSKNGTFEELFSLSTSFKTCNMAVDPSGLIWLLVDTVGLVAYDHDGNEMGAFDPREPSSEDLGSDNVADISDLSLSSSLQVDAEGIAYFSSGGILYRFGPLTTSDPTPSLADMKEYSGTSAWFICGQETQTHVPATTDALLSACALNGIKWQVDLQGKLFFSSSQMNYFATSGAGTSSCDAAADKVPICNVVADLPPYICTRSLSAVPVTYIGAAAGSAHLVYAVFVLLVSALLTASTRPPPAAWYGTEIANHRVHSDDDSNKGLLLSSGFHAEGDSVQAEVVHLRERVASMEGRLSDQGALLNAQQNALADLQAQVGALRRDAAEAATISRRSTDKTISNNLASM